jgi:hypothetical protein
VTQFLSGFLMAMCLVAAMLFLKAWRDTRDQLFLMFGIAFWLMSLERVMLTVLRLKGEAEMPVYVLRLAAFALIAVAILLKNRPEPRP